MGKQLKSADILGEIAEEETTNVALAAEQIESDISEIDRLKEQAKASAIGKPSPYQADLRARLRDKRQLNFANIPSFIIDAFDALRKQASPGGMNRREYLYHLLRKEGADIPLYKEMDGRKL